MNIIASADNNWAIGKNNELLIRIPQDMKRFRQMTTGNVVVMGRKTLESFPNQAPLKEDIYVIGGDSIYRQMLDLCDTAYITKIDYAYEADAHLPNLEKDPAWSLTEESEEQTYFDVIYTYQIYKRG